MRVPCPPEISVLNGAGNFFSFNSTANTGAGFTQSGFFTRIVSSFLSEMPSQKALGHWLLFLTAS